MKMINVLQIQHAQSPVSPSLSPPLYLCLPRSLFRLRRCRAGVFDSFLIISVPGELGPVAACSWVGSQAGPPDEVSHSQLCFCCFICISFSFARISHCHFGINAADIGRINLLLLALSCYSLCIACRTTFFTPFFVCASLFVCVRECAIMKIF